jgi:hypothetical protein
MQIRKIKGVKELYKIKQMKAVHKDGQWQISRIKI